MAGRSSQVMSDSSREEELFTAALAQPANERAIFLTCACAGDEILRVKIAALLAAYERAPAYLDTSPVGDPVVFLAEKAGDRIGRYKLLRKLGEGGCGSVHLAEQEEPVRREVALKIIKLGMDTETVIARFEAERQALALMDHPNIAQVFDAGATDTGRPYFVMELVRGVPISKFAEENNLTLAARLQLFIQVCQAIQHAHQKGVIHRDIKPSNILVAQHDGIAVPKVIDFGVAKATQGRLTEHATFTAFEQFIGTPAYMSPEQATLSGVDIDTRSDIYSLGALLYELLTGSPPFDTRTLLQAGLDELRRHIREVEPPPPSAKVSLLPLDARTQVARRRQTTAAKLPALLRGDLDCIVMRCLEKDRQRRYNSASGLAADVQRYLDHDPITARPPSAVYRVRKMMQRHRLAFAAGTVVAASLVGGLALSTVMLFRERAERQRAVIAEQEQIKLRRQTEIARANEAALRLKAEADEKKAVTEAARSAQVARFMQDLLKGVGPRVALGRDTKLLHDILDDTAQRLGRDLTNQPEVEAQLRMTMGETYNELGDYRSGIAMFETALALRRQLLGSEHLIVATTLEKLGEALCVEGKLPEAENHLREALAIQRTFPDSSGIPAAKPLALALVLQGKGSEGEALLREALALERKRGSEHLEVADALNVLSYLLWLEGKLPDAEAAAREELSLRRKLQNNDEAIAKALFAYGQLLGNERKFPEAEAALREALMRQRRRSANEHPDLADCLDKFSDVLRQEGNFVEAEAFCREALTMRQKLLGNTHPQVAMSLRHLGMILVARGSWSDAEPPLREALQIERTLHLDLQALSTLPWLLETLEHLGHLADAETTCCELLDLQRRTYDRENGLIAATLMRLGTLLRSEGKLTQAETSEREATTLRASLSGPDMSGETARQAASRSVLLLQQVRVAEAEALCRDELAQARAQHGAESMEAALALETLYTVLLREERWPEAETATREAMELWRKLRGDQDPHFALAGAALGSVFLRENKPAEAERVLGGTLAIVKSLNLPLANTVLQQLAEAQRLQHETEIAGAAGK
jgi:eukaryotic-like serine/threonine-protein kinase